MGTRQKRLKSIGNLYSKKFDTISWQTEEYREAFPEVETSGCWLIWGSEKNGKTRFALMLANELSKTGMRVMYVTAEEGFSKSFVENCEKSGLEIKNRRIQFEEYIEYKELETRLEKRNSPDVIFLDNATVYEDEIKKVIFKSLLKKFNRKLFILIAHAERYEPYTALARFCRKLSNVAVYVEGLRCNVSGRLPDATLNIDAEKAQIYHGNELRIKN